MEPDSMEIWEALERMFPGALVTRQDDFRFAIDDAQHVVSNETLPGNLTISLVNPKPDVAGLRVIVDATN